MTAPDSGIIVKNVTNEQAPMGANLRGRVRLAFQLNSRPVVMASQTKAHEYGGTRSGAIPEPTV